ncbi:hypothetical protein EV696_1211 [Permianibacter aggregans]|uniref:Uncharacterized protein n=2 Tax=Permianibacter aggregans TaxID=1510150 RepID=A0A4R6UIC5_9GAMM|nr:hypothetical protein EV696_1211 [Permianibacter aggregans]
MLSAFEHLVPEQLFSTNEQQAEGVSAVKAIAIANGQGQRIYTINQSNLETALSHITLDIDTENDIRAAVESGKQVTTHQNPITYHGWTGAGYIITDTESGAGAYKISGGADGAVLIILGLAMFFLSFYVLAASSSALLLSPQFIVAFIALESAAFSLISCGISKLMGQWGDHVAVTLFQNISRAFVSAAVGAISTYLGVSIPAAVMTGIIFDSASNYWYCN